MADAEVKKAAPKKAAAPKEKKEAPKEVVKKDNAKNLYILWREEDRKWLVKKEGSDKPMKLFFTKDEAETYANDLAEKQGVRVVRLKKDGKFQKEKY